MGDNGYLARETDGYVDGNPGFRPHADIGNYGASIWAYAREPLRKKPNCLFVAGFLVVAKRLRSGDELLVSYGPGHLRDYPVSRYVLTKQDFPSLTA